ncbi:hypothetical protein MPH_01836 [Macrophomina phaseolina MS6]|uniref:Uncharacterized protein n=1 Tax=Macrophomina phaseolina (strain MS6) TaxID=1126212 RepID=K2S1F1_MACPH|nr:hypothetical protein MPH_01836 [Macrophomina phaseolina MS6]
MSMGNVLPGQHASQSTGQCQRCFRELIGKFTWDVEISSQVHRRNNLRDDGVFWALHPPTKRDDAHYAGGVALEVFDVPFGAREHVQRNSLALIILEGAVFADLLNADAGVHQLTVNPPAVSSGLCFRIHVEEILLACTELGEDKHAWTRAVDACPLFEELGSSPGIIDPDGWIPCMEA